MSNITESKLSGAEILNATDSIPHSIDGKVVAAVKAQYQSTALAALSEMQKMMDVINQQAEDDGIWFIAETITEDYLQSELRRLQLCVEICYESLKRELEKE